MTPLRQWLVGLLAALSLFGSGFWFAHWLLRPSIEIKVRCAQPAVPNSGVSKPGATSV